MPTRTTQPNHQMSHPQPDNAQPDNQHDQRIYLHISVSPISSGLLAGTDAVVMILAYPIPQVSQTPQNAGRR